MDSRKPARPREVHVEIVRGCSANCASCVAPIKGTADGPTQYEMARPTWLAAAGGAQLYVPGAPVYFDGYGDPTLHGELLKIVSDFRATMPESPLILRTAGIGMVRATYDTFEAELANLFKAGVDQIRFHLAPTELSDRFSDLLSLIRPKAGFVINSEVLSTPILGKKEIVVVHRMCPPKGIVREPHLRLGSGAERVPCHEPDIRLVIAWDGSYSLCINDASGALKSARVNFQTPRRFWEEHPILQEYRGKLRLGDRSLWPCVVCTAGCAASRAPKADKQSWAANSGLALKVGSFVVVQIDEPLNPHIHQQVFSGPVLESYKTASSHRVLKIDAAGHGPLRILIERDTLISVKAGHE